MKRAAALSLAGILSLFSSAVASTLTTTTSTATSFENQRKILRASSGTLALVYQKGSPSSTGGLWLALSRDGGITWKDDLKLTAGRKVYADAHLGAGDDISLVYSTNNDSVGTVNDVTFARLRYTAALDRWTLERTAMVHDAGDTTGAYNAVLARDAAYLWAAYRFNNGSTYGIVIRYSADDGRSWHDSLVSDDAGPDGDETAVFAKLEHRLVLIYYHQNTQLRWRWRSDMDPPTVWSASQLIRTVDSFASKSAYSAVAVGDRIHLLFNDKGVKYLRYDGVSWTSTPVTVAPLSGSYPTLAADGGDLWALWQEPLGSNQYPILGRRFDGDTQTWEAVTRQISPASEQKPARLFAYSSSAGSFTDLTSQAGSKTSGDMKHATTGTLARDVDDAVYFGATVPFDYLRVQLSVKGYLGRVQWEYWDGFAWVPFAPISGPYDFLGSASVQLWPDASRTPPDWAARSVNGSVPLYYARARVTIAFATGPVGSQMTSHKYNRNVTAIGHGSGLPVAAWVSGTSTYHVALGRIDP